VRSVLRYCGEHFYHSLTAITTAPSPLKDTHSSGQIENGVYVFIEFKGQEQADAAIRIIQQKPDPIAEVNIRLSAVKFDETMSWPRNPTNIKNEMQRKSFACGRTKLATKLLRNGLMEVQEYPGFEEQLLDPHDAMYHLLDRTRNHGNQRCDTVAASGDGDPYGINHGQLLKKQKKQRALNLRKQTANCEQVELENLQGTEIFEIEDYSMSRESPPVIDLRKPCNEADSKDPNGIVTALAKIQAQLVSSGIDSPHLAPLFSNTSIPQEMKSPRALTKSLQVTSLDIERASDLQLEIRQFAEIRSQSDVGNEQDGVMIPLTNDRCLEDSPNKRLEAGSQNGMHPLLSGERPEPILPQKLSLSQDNHESTTIIEESIRLKHISNNEREFQTRYWGIASDDDLVRCSMCSTEGHMIDNCPSRVCKHCGVSWSHFSGACPSMQHLRKCCKCRERGHTIEQCTSKLFRSVGDGFSCDICTGNHVEEECSWIWRTFKPDEAKGLRKVDNLIISCYECGSSQHWGDDCLSRERSKPIHCNTFSSSFANLFSRTPVTRANAKDGISIRGRAQQTAIQSDRDLGELSNFYGKKVDTHRLPVTPMKIKLQTPKAQYEPAQYQSGYKPTIAKSYIGNTRYGTVALLHESSEPGHSRTELRITSPLRDSRPDGQYKFRIPPTQKASKRPIDEARNRYARESSSMQYGAMRPIDEARNRYARDSNPTPHGTKDVSDGYGVGATSYWSYY